jgi:hypothetical protein
VIIETLSLNAIPRLAQAAALYASSNPAGKGCTNAAILLASLRIAVCGMAVPAKDSVLLRTLIFWSSVNRVLAMRSVLAALLLILRTSRPRPSSPGTVAPSGSSGRGRADATWVDREFLRTSALIRTMAEAKPLWGLLRIHGELLKLGIHVSQATVEVHAPAPTTALIDVADVSHESCRPNHRDQSGRSAREEEDGGAVWGERVSTV